jgi:hypothetical protein
MLTRLRTALLPHRAGAALLWTLGALTIAAIVGHAPLDALAAHAGDHTVAGAPGEIPADEGHHHDGGAADLTCGVGEALCAVGVVLGLFLLRRLVAPPSGGLERLRRIWPRPPARAGAAGVTRFLEPPDLARLVRLQI